MRDITTKQIIKTRNMEREEAKEMLPNMQAFAGGKTIQDWTNDTWKDEEYASFGELSQSPIKPQPKYRPFKSQEECWEEMHKHPDFGWIIAKDSKIMYHIYVIGIGHVLIHSMSISFPETFAEYEFTDGTPFGIKEE